MQRVTIRFSSYLQGVDGDGAAPPAVQVADGVDRRCAAKQHQPAEQLLLGHREQDVEHAAAWTDRWKTETQEEMETKRKRQVKTDRQRDTNEGSDTGIKIKKWGFLKYILAPASSMQVLSDAASDSVCVVHLFNAVSDTNVCF